MNSTKLNNAIAQWFVANDGCHAAVQAMLPAYLADVKALRQTVMGAMQSQAKYNKSVLVVKAADGTVTFTLERDSAAIKAFGRLMAQLKMAAGGAVQERKVVELPRGIKTAVKGLLATYTATQIRAALTELTAKK